MPSEITHKSGFSPMKYLAWLAVFWVFGYVVGLNHGAAGATQPAIPEPAPTVQITPQP